MNMFSQIIRRANISPPLTLDEAEEKRFQYLDACAKEKEDAYSFTVTFNLTSEQLLRLCALQTSGGYNTPTEAFNAMLRSDSYSLINARLLENERALDNYWAERGRDSGAVGASAGKGESG